MIDDSTAFAQFMKACLESNNNKAEAKILKKRFNLDYSDEIIRKAIGLFKNLADRDGLQSQDFGLQLTRQKLDKNGVVVSEVYSERSTSNPVLPKGRIKAWTEVPFSDKKFIKYEAEDGSVDYDAVFDSLFKKYDGWKAPKFNSKAKVNKSGKIAVLNLYDAHLDKVALPSETGEDDNLETNINRYVTAFDSLFEKIKAHKPETIIYPVGNDLYHTNGMNGKTKKGPDLQYFCSPEEAYESINDVVIESIAKLLEYTKVHVPFILGNHDEDKVNILGFWINKLFKDHPNFECNNSREQRKYWQGGQLLLGFAHGDKEKRKIAQLPLMMAQEKPQLWAKTKIRKFYCGDLHHNFQYNFMKSKDQIGVEVEFLRSIGCSDKYHVSNGWIGIPKTAESTIYCLDGSEEYNARVNF